MNINTTAIVYPVTRQPDQVTIERKEETLKQSTVKPTEATAATQVVQEADKPLSSIIDTRV